MDCLLLLLSGSQHWPCCTYSLHVHVHCELLSGSLWRGALLPPAGLLMHVHVHTYMLHVNTCTCGMYARPFVNCGSRCIYVYVHVHVHIHVHVCVYIISTCTCTCAVSSPLLLLHVHVQKYVHMCTVRRCTCAG